MNKRTLETCIPETPVITGEVRDYDSRPLQTPSCVVFNDSDSTQVNQPLDIALDNSTISEEIQELLSLSELPGLANDNTLILPMCTSDRTNVDSSTDFVTTVIQDNNQECTSESISTMDNPLTDQFTDLSSLLDPTFLDSLSLLPPQQQTLHPFLNNPDSNKILDLQSPETSISTLSPLSTSPSTPSDNVVPSCSPIERKRKSSLTDIDSNGEPELKKSPQDKYIERRKKNNVASQISRAKRRQKSHDLFAREKELEKQNAELKIKVEEMTKEAEKLKRLLIEQLAH